MSRIRPDVMSEIPISHYKHTRQPAVQTQQRILSRIPHNLTATNQSKLGCSANSDVKLYPTTQTSHMVVSPLPTPIALLTQSMLSTQLFTASSSWAFFSLPLLALPASGLWFPGSLWFFSLVVGLSGRARCLWFYGPLDALALVYVSQGHFPLGFQRSCWFH